MKNVIKKFKAEDILVEMIDILILYIEELFEFSNDSENQFAYGERTAYTECLEILQRWEKAEIYGLDFEIEERYPL